MKEHAPGDPIIPISISFDERLTRFETEAEAQEECKKIGAKSALPKIVTTMRKALNLGSFFTTGADEVRQWTIRNGTKAPQAAGVIHGDFEKGEANGANAGLALIEAVLRAGPELLPPSR